MVENNDLRKTLLDEMDRAEENLKDLEVQFLEMPNPFADEVCKKSWEKVLGGEDTPELNLADLLFPMIWQSNWREPVRPEPDDFAGLSENITELYCEFATNSF